MSEKTAANTQRQLISSQGSPPLDSLLTRFATVVHPQIYDCRSCPQDINHCPQDMIDKGQKGKVWTLFNGCSDSRAQPGVVFQPHPGEIFPTTGAGALLTPYEYPNGTNNTWGSIEYAVSHLGVKELVQFGHTECGAMAGLVAMAKGADLHGAHLKSMLAEVIDLEVEAERRFVKQNQRIPTDVELQRELEFHAVRVATNRMQQFVDTQHPDKGIRVHGWIYDVRGANILALQPDDTFAPITHLPSRVDYGALPGSCAQGVNEIEQRLVYRPMPHQCSGKCHAPKVA